MKKSGFTLIEIIVVTASVGLIMTAVTGIVLSTLKSQNRTKSSSRVVQNGSWILSELRKNVLNSGGKEISCASNKLSVTMTNLSDMKVTTISCSNTAIASTSGVLVRNLNGSEIKVTNCQDFVTCDLLPSSEVSAVTFNFGIGSTINGIGTTQNFNLKVTVRN